MQKLEEIDNKYIFQQGSEEDMSDYIKVKMYSEDPDTSPKVIYYKRADEYESMGF